jgi:predicted MFS family arabinose efflux permease
MTATTTSFGAAGPSPSNASLSGLDGVNFFIAGISAAFGPYVAVYLADQKWTQENIGFVLTASGLAGLLSQLPGGELLDTIRSKLSTTLFGLVAVSFGRTAVFLSIASVALLAALILWFLMPETRPSTKQ